MARVVLGIDEALTVPSNMDFTVYGTGDGSEQITIQNNATTSLGDSFNSGNDSVVFASNANDYEISKDGATVTITGPDGGTSTIPAGTSGMDLEFNDATRVLQIDTDTNQVMLGDQEITDTPEPVQPGEGQAPNVEVPTGVSVAADAADGTEVANVDVSDPDGTIESVSFTEGNVDVNDNGEKAFSINDNGVVNVNDTDDLIADGDNDPFNLTVQATDNDDLTAQGSFQIDVTAATDIALSADSASYDEGQTASFGFSSNLAENTEVAYTIEGDVNVDDIAGDSLSGTTTVDADGNATIEVTLKEDRATEGEETLTVSLDDYDADASTQVEDTSKAGETLTLTQGTDFVGPDSPENPDNYDEVLTSTEDNDTIEGATSALTSERTLASDDHIDGGEGSDTLSVDMDSSFNGFSEDGGLSNVETVELTNVSTISRSFSADGAEGVEEYTIDASEAGVNLSNLAAAGITVNLNNQEEGSASFDFTDDAVSGTEDALAVNLSNVGTNPDDADPTNVGIESPGIEEMTLSSEGDSANRVDLSDSNEVENISADGAQDLTISAVGDSAETLDASTATGDVFADLTGTVESVSSVSTGDGDDQVVLSLDQMGATAELTGGAGENVLTFDAGSTTIRPTLANFQTVEFGAIDGDVTVSGENISDLTDVSLLETSAGSDVTLANLSGTPVSVETVGQQDQNSEFTYTGEEGLTFATLATDETAEDNGQDTVSRGVSASNTSEITVDVGEYTNYAGTVDAGSANGATLNVASAEDDNNEEQTQFTGDLNAANAESVVVDAQGTLNGAINASSATSANITAAKGGILCGGDLSAVESLTVQAGDALNMSDVGQLEAISSVDLSGEGSVELGALGATDSVNDVALTATGLPGDPDADTPEDGLTTGDINVAADRSIEVNAAEVTGMVNLGAMTVENADGEYTGSVNLNLNGTGNDVTVGDDYSDTDIRAASVTVEAGNLLGTLDDSGDGQIDVDATSATIYGPSTASSDFNVEAEEITYEGGTEDDTITVAGTVGDDDDEAVLDISTDLGTNDITLNGMSALEGSSITGDVGEDTLEVDKASDLTEASVSNIEDIDLDGGDLTLTGAQVEGFADAVSYEDVDSDGDSVDLEIGADDVDLSEINSSFADVIGDVDFDENETTLTMTADQFDAVDTWTEDENATVVVDDSAATAAAGVDASTPTFAGSLDYTGSDHNDVITGGAGDDVITGGTGTNTYNSSAGADTYVGTKGEKATFIYDDDADSEYTFNDSGDVDTFDFGAYSDSDSFPTDNNLDLSSVVSNGIGSSSNVDVKIDAGGTSYDDPPASSDLNFSDDDNLDVYVDAIDTDGSGNADEAEVYMNINDDSNLDDSDMQVNLTGIEDLSLVDNFGDFVTVA